MKIKVRQLWRTEGLEQEIEDYVKLTINQDHHDGQLESIDTRVRNQTEIIGRLLDHLAAHHIISAPSLTHLVNGYPDEEAKYTE